MNRKIDPRPRPEDRPDERPAPPARSVPDVVPRQDRDGSGPPEELFERGFTDRFKIRMPCL